MMGCTLAYILITEVYKHKNLKTERLTNTRAALGEEVAETHRAVCAARAVPLAAHVTLATLDQHALADPTRTHGFITRCHAA